jgi:hypothetical protein
MSGIMPEQSKCRLVITERLRVLWCRLMHDAPMWPIHGIYRCRTCGQSYPVPWAGEHLVWVTVEGPQEGEVEWQNSHY